MGTRVGVVQHGREEFEMQQAIKGLIANELVSAVHDVADGGLYVTLVEMSMPRGLGFDIVSDADIRLDAFLFGEGQSRVVVSVAIDKVQQVESLLGNFPFEKIGVVTSGEMVIDGDFWGTIDWWQEKYDTAIENYLTKYIITYFKLIF